MKNLYKSSMKNLRGKAAVCLLSGWGERMVYDENKNLRLNQKGRYFRG